jgi:type VI secretion system protein ImpG
MSQELYRYYERELVFIRQLAQEFARQYPAAANRLLLEPNRSADPHVERLIEAFALLTARVHHKLDDEFPELTDALLGILYPHYLAPIPSMAIVQFQLDPGRSQLPNGFRIDKHSRLHTQPIGDLACKFRTGYPVTLWPVELTTAKLMPPPFPPNFSAPPRTAAVLRLQFECQAEMKFAALSLDKLRFYLFGEAQLIPSLYELLFNHVTQVAFRPLDKAVEKGPEPTAFVLPPSGCLTQVGFDVEDGLLPYPSRSFPGYRLLTEFFTFPNKFQFVDLGGFRRVCQGGFQKKLEVLLYLNRTLKSLEQVVDAQTFRLGCAPVINLFEQVAEPIPLTQTKHSYRIVPDVAHPRGMEVYSVDEVTSTDPVTSTTTDYQPFYSFQHGRSRDNQKMFWYTSRRPSLDEGDRGTELELNLVDLGFDPHVPAEAVLILRATCTNRDLPAQLQQAGEEALYFELEAAAPLSRIRCLRTPTTPLRPPVRRGAHWRLVSHLALNHLSLTDPFEGREALQEILRLYDFSDPEAGQQLAAVTQQLIEGITSLNSRRVVGRTGSEISSGFARGLEVTIEFDEQKYVGTGLFLFASVLERFLGLYASINSFTQLVAKTRQGEGYLKKWPPRAAEIQLL